MSFLNDIVSAGKKAVGFLQGNSIGSSIAKAATLGLLINQVTKSMNKENSKPDAANSSQPVRYTKEQLSPNTNHSVPVVYGTAFVKGIITDAYMTSDNKTMWFAVTICEKTGTLLSASNADSVLSFVEIYRNNEKLTFDSDGITVAKGTDEDGVDNTDIDGLIEVYCYNDGSNNPVVPVDYTNNTLYNANFHFPTWGSTHLMSNLVFVLVKVTYNKEKRVTNLGDWQFKIQNTLTQPGDVLYDYMTNTRYGAGIDSGDIYAQ